MSIFKRFQKTTFNLLYRTTKNPNVSDEAKESAQERLKEMGQ